MTGTRTALSIVVLVVVSWGCKTARERLPDAGGVGDAGDAAGPPDRTADLAPADSRDGAVDRGADAPVDGPAGEAGALANGGRCAHDDECASGHCADGVCCDGACTGQCESCAEPDGGAGTCLIVAGVPRAGRPACGGTAPCAGTCDGRNGAACTFPGNSVPCTAGSCSNGSVTTATTCNGSGACTAATTNGCSTNQCADGTKCSAGCNASAPCAQGKYCDPTGVCLATKPAGASCKTGAECDSTYCVDNVCCASACGGQCQACNEPNSPGTCVTVSGAPRGSRTPCAGTQATCAGKCDGVSPTACSYAGAQVTCVAPTCSSDFTLVSASVCNGAGACTTTTTSTCSGASYCSVGTCTAQVGNGGPCQRNPQCASGNCSSAVCCAAGQTGCGGSCFDLTRDNAHCGACATVCTAGSQTCQGGACLLDDGQPCTANAQCVSGTCTIFYVDGDRDGYGSSAQGGFCTITAPPVGYATLAGDCCDTNAAVNPGVTAWSSTPAPACPTGTMVSPWDYNCDGTVDTEFLDAVCGPLPACAVTRVNFPESNCGQQPASTCTCSHDDALTICMRTCGQVPFPQACH